MSVSFKRRLCIPGGSCHWSYTVLPPTKKSQIEPEKWLQDVQWPGLNVGGTCHSRTITDGLVKLLHDALLDDWMTKLVAVCTDRAAVNVGMYNDILPKLWQLVCFVLKLMQSYLQKCVVKNSAGLNKLYEENGISFVKLGKFDNIRWSTSRHETLLKVSKLLPAFQIQLATSNGSDQ